IAALPKSLRGMGVDIRVVLPKYRGIPDDYLERMAHVGETRVRVGWREQYCGIESLVEDGVTIYFVDNEYYFGRDGIYGYMDDGERFSFFNRAVLEILPVIGFQPDVLHCHDWHTAMIPLLLEDVYRHDPYYAGIRTVFTIHNLL
ncbi:starch synthase, partial [Clostridium perfringens]